MLKQEYPKWIPNPVENGPDQLVQDEAGHKAKNRKHYENFVANREIENNPDSPQALGQAVYNERERCAVIAETFEGAGEIGAGIAEAIRKTAKVQAKKEPAKEEKLPVKPPTSPAPQTPAQP